MSGTRYDAISRTVQLIALSRYVTDGELEDIRAIMPKDLRSLVPEHSLERKRS